MNLRRPTNRQFATCLLLSAVLVLGIVQWSFLPVLIQNASFSGQAAVEVSPGHTSKFAASSKFLLGDFLRPCLKRSSLLDLRNRVVRDVRTAWLDANTDYSRLSVTKQLVEQANLALDLSQTRYNLGLGSIVELSQAQVQATQAEIGNAAARYLYRLAEANLRFQTGQL